MRTSKLIERWHLAVLAGVLALGASGRSSAEAVLDQEAQARNVAIIEAGIVQQMTQRPTRAEADRLPLLERLLSDRQRQLGYLKVRGIKPVNRRGAVSGGLQRNLNLAIAGAEPDRTKALLQEIEAVFDPILDLQVGYNYKRTFTREKIGRVREKIFMPQGDAASGAAPNVPSNINRRRTFTAFGGDPEVIAMEWYQDASSNIVEEEIKASSANAVNFGHPEQKTNFTLQVSQQLPWGGSVSVTDQTLFQKIYYNKNSEGWQDDGAWTTNITLQLDTPVPFAKGFGEWNLNSAAIRRAEVVRDRADWGLKAVVNQTMRDVDFAYFDLVRRLEVLESTVKNRDLVAKLQARMNRLFEAGEGTRYQKAQLDAEFAKAGIRVEQALQSYIAASIALAQLIGDPDVKQGDVIYLPYAYTQSLESKAEFEVEQAVKTAQANRPELFMAEADRKLADIAMRVAENQARPDIKINGSATLAQDGTTMGYEHPLHSHNRIVRPDTINQAYGITYTYPWMNRAAVARQESAELGVQVAELSQRATQVDVRREITQGLVGLQSARAQARLTADQVRTRQSAFGSLVRQQEEGIVSEDELINAARALLNAELARVDARIQAQQAETQLLFAQGVIAGALPAETAQTRLEQHRLQMLAEGGRLTYFR